MSTHNNDNKLYTESLKLHAQNPQGKVGIYLTKPLMNQYDLSLAYSPGVAAPCLEINNNPNLAFEYTSKGNFVAVITNGTAVLGLGNLGALASKPVMEGKAALFKRFADINAVDIEVDTNDPEKFINAVRYLGPTWGGINLEDIKAPECFIIERELKKHMDIPVFHDDQHGTAIITSAALINAADLTKRKLEDLKIVVNGAGAAAIACIELIKKLGVKHENVILCDTQGVIYKGRTNGMNEWKAAHAIDTNLRTLEEAISGAEVFIGLSVKGAMSKEMVAKMANNPIIFAMANPDPEISPDEVRSVRSDAIIATGRSDYNNQINNLMGFPYIFRGALDVQATTINDEMKIAAVNALARLAREDATEEIEIAYAGRKCHYGPEYIIPVPFDSRLIQEVSAAVAEAAIKSGVARKIIEDFPAYKRQLAARINPAAHVMNHFLEQSLNNPKRIIFAEGEEEQMIKAALQWRSHRCGQAILVGHTDVILEKLAKLGMKELDESIIITNAAVNPNTQYYIDTFYKKAQRKGQIYRDCMRLIKRDRNIFAASMLENGEADGMVTGLTRDYLNSLDDVTKVIECSPNKILLALSALVKRDKMVFIADTAINESPTAPELAEIAIQAAQEVRKMGHEPRVAFLSFSNFGNPMRNGANLIREAVSIMDKKNVDFEYDGDITANVALNPELLKLYPFCRLSEPANLLIMPSLHSASIATKLLQEFGKATLIGPLLCGLDKSVQILPMRANSADVFNSAIIAANRSER